jgi:HK97 family phage prohead protease
VPTTKAPAGIERKAIPLEVKSIKGRTVTGIFSVFGVRDSYDDIIEPGAFVNTIVQRGAQVLHLWQHDMEEPPIAKIDTLRELTRNELPQSLRSRFPEATGGAEVTRTYMDTPRANEVLALLSAGVPLQMSFAFEPIRFTVIEDELAEWGYTRRLQEVRLYETSDVNWGANEATVASTRAWLPKGKGLTRSAAWYRQRARLAQASLRLAEQTRLRKTKDRAVRAALVLDEAHDRLRRAGR